MTKRFMLEESVRRLRVERLEAFKEKEERQKLEKLQRLLDALDEPENHDFAIYQINQMGLDAVEALIDTLANDHDPDARYGSARALGQICAEKEVKVLIKARTAKALIKALSDPEPAVRYWAAEALGKCQSRVAINPLAELLRDPHEGVRLQAEDSLQKIGGEDIQEVLDQAKSGGFLSWLRGK
jgi:HEAT repeat protein